MIHLDHLPDALADEKLIQVHRRHPITALGLIASLIVILILPIASFIVIKINSPEVLNNQALSTLIVLGGGLFFMFALLFIYQHFMDYWLDVWIVTNRRIINIEQNGLFSRTISELRLYRIQDVTSKVDGFVRSMLHFGMVYVQTAGEKHYFVFEDVPDPTGIAKNILQLAEIDRQEHMEEAMETMGQTTIDKHPAIREKTTRHLEP